MDANNFPPGSGVIYARVSSEEQAQGHSLEAQVDRGRDYAAAHKITVVKEFVVVESAKNAGRKCFTEMVDFIRQRPEIQHIVVEKMDRWARNYKEIGLIEDLVNEKKCIHFVRDGFCIHERSNTSDYLRLGAAGFFSTFFKRDQMEKVRKGMEKAVSKGLYPHQAPFGYKTNHETKVKEPHPEKGPVLVRIKELAAEGRSLSQIRETIRGEGFTMAAHPQWLADVIRDPFGTGRFLWGGKWREGVHKPLISWELHSSAIRGLERLGKARPHSLDFPYSGLIRCGLCGRSVVFELAKGKYVYARCAGRQKCGNDRVRQADLDPMLAAPINGIRMSEEVVRWVAAKLAETDKTTAARRQQQADGMRREISKLVTLQERAYEDKVMGELPDDLWRSKRDKWQHEKLRLQGLLDELAQEQTTSSNAAAGCLLELAKNLTAAYFSATPHERAEILRLVCSDLVLERGKLTFSYRKPFELLSRTGPAESWGPLAEEVRTAVNDAGATFADEVQRLHALVQPYLVIRMESGKFTTANAAA